MHPPRPVELYPPTEPCPCTSGLLAAECCIPVDAPVARRGEHFGRLDADAALVDVFGRQMPLPADFTVTTVVNLPQQLDRTIERIADEVRRAVRPLAEDAPPAQLEWVERCGRLISNQQDALYALRYHQRQFFSRLRVVTTQQTSIFEPPRGNVVLRFDDKPLRYELEAFLVRVRTTMDAVAKLVSFLLGRKPRTYGKLCQLLETDVSLDAQIRRRIRTILKANDTWISAASDLRNKIVHEADFDGFEGVGHDRTLFLDARLGDVNAGAFCIRVWRNIQAMVPALVVAAADRR